MRGINKSQKIYTCITDCYMLPKYYLKLYSAHKNIKAKNWNSLKDILILCPATDFYKQVGIHISYKIILKTQETGVFVTWAPYTQNKVRTFFCNILEYILQILKNVFTSNTFTIIHQPCDTELPVIQNVSRLRWKISMMICYDYTLIHAYRIFAGRHIRMSQDLHWGCPRTSKGDVLRVNVTQA